MIEHKLSVKDKQLIQGMQDALTKYVHTALSLSPEAWETISRANTVVWQEVEAQRGFLAVCISSGVVELDEFDDI